MGDLAGDVAKYVGRGAERLLAPVPDDLIKRDQMPDRQQRMTAGQDAEILVGQRDGERSRESFRGDSRGFLKNAGMVEPN